MSEHPAQSGHGAASTPKGERRRQALIDAAGQLLVEGGFDIVRHRAVADRAGVPLASTTYYFDSLDSLVIEAVRQAVGIELKQGKYRLAQSSEEQPLDKERVADLLLDFLIGPASRNGGADVVLLRYERLVASSRRRYLRQLQRELNREADEHVAEILLAGGFQVTDSQRERIVAVVDGAVIGALIDIEDDPRAVARRMLLGEFDRVTADARACDTAR